jgi:hypothetical protein
MIALCRMVNEDRKKQSTRDLSGGVSEGQAYSPKDGSFQHEETSLKVNEKSHTLT